MQTRSLFATIILIGVGNLVGCGKPAEPPTTPTASQNAATVDVNATNETPPTADAAVPTATPDMPAADSVVTAEPAAKDAEPIAAPTTPASDQTPAKPAVATIRPYEPTAAQLAKWKQPDFQPLQLLACRDLDQAALVTSSLMLPDGKQFLTAGTQLTLWSLDADKPVQTLAKLAQDTHATTLVLSPNGKWFALGDSVGNVQVWSVADKKLVHEKKLQPTGVVQLDASPDGKQLATISFDDTVSLWNVSDLSPVSSFKVDTNGLKRIAFVSEKLLAAAGETTSIYDIASGKMDRKLTSGRYNFTLQTNGDRSHLIYGNGEAIHLQKIADGTEQVLAGPFASNELVSLSPDHHWLATANGATLRIWSVDEAISKQPQLVQVYDAVGYPMVDLQWSNDGSLLSVVSQSGRIRLYGTADSGSKFSLKPLMPPVPPFTQNSDTPATPVQLLACIDLRTFPRPPASTTELSDAKQLMLSSPGTVDEVTQFYQYFLGKAGWTEVPSETPLPGNHEFRKDHFMLNLLVQESGPQCNVSINHAGRLDLRKLPRLDGDQQLIYANENTVMYRAKAKVPQIEAALLRKLQAAGWCPYSRLNSAHNDAEDRRDLSLLRGSAELLVSISQTPEDRESCMVQYSRLTTMNSLPLPADSSYVEFDGSTQPRLVAFSKTGLNELAKFYETKLAEEGWVKRNAEQDKKGQVIWLSFIQDQKDLLVGLSDHKDGRTLVTIGDGVFDSSWQLSKKDEKAEGDADGSTVAGIEAADFPILNESKQAKYDSLDQSIEIIMDKTTLAQAGEAYEKALNALGWESDGVGIRDAEYVMLRFKKGEAELTVRGRVSAGTTMINVQGDGLLWTKQPAGGAKITSYETWLKIHQHPATLDLLDQFLDEMVKVQSGQ